MRQVFTLWPAEEGAAAQRGVEADSMPAWAQSLGPGEIKPRWTARDWLAVALATAVVIPLALVVPSGLHGWIAAGTLIALSLGLAVAGIVTHRRRVTKLQRELQEARRWNDIIFERTGIALWREDWTAARDAVLALLHSGVHDMQAHFAAHPDELRAIRARVIVKDVNGFAVVRTGAPSREALLGSLDKILPDTDQTFVQWLVAFANGDPVYRSETHITRPDGEAVDTLFTAGLPTNMQEFEDILVSDLDITEYKATQRRLAQAEQEISRQSRISTMGALTASIAHEVNSPLAAIVSNAEASLRWLQRDDPDLAEAEAGLVSVIGSAKRATAVVERTRAFLSNAPVQAEPQDIVRLAHDSIMLIDRELRAHGASAHVRATDGLPRAMADAINVQQVLVNLMINAVQAMSGQTGPKDLTVGIERDGDQVRVDVADCGPGIAPEHLRAIFEPLFSTKEGGMGMGLAICQTSIAAHGGRLWVDSLPGDGAIFHFTLPVAPDA